MDVTYLFDNAPACVGVPAAHNIFVDNITLYQSITNEPYKRRSLKEGHWRYLPYDTPSSTVMPVPLLWLHESSRCSQMYSYNCDALA